MATATRKKSPAYEAGVREGAAMRKRGSKAEISPETEEEMDSAKGRKRDGSYGKKLMDAPCTCGKKRGKAKCDGSCGKKMDRNDALTPQEYLAACELGIQGCSRSYIRARLDSAARLDLKCGKGAISEGEKCTKGPAQKVDPNTRKGLTGKALLTAGLAVGGGYLALKHGRSAVKEVKEIGGSVKSLMEKNTKLRALQAQNKRMGIQGEGENSFTRFLDRVAPDKRRKTLERAFKKPDAKRPRRRDSIWAEGF